MAADPVPSFEHLDRLIALTLPRLAAIYAILLVGMIVVMFTDSSILTIFLVATMVNHKIISVDLLPILAIMGALNFTGIAAFGVVLYRASRIGRGAKR